ncbi:hypothetical protein [Streptomyces sp. NPDC017673]|uniref:hypothetical protein n=1 Tax=unclassified Streptomyces TaxID=2593676 RepID=UPI003788D9F5
MFRCERAEPPADVRLDPYRRAAARLMDGDEQVGVLMTTVTTWWWREDPVRRRRWVNPRELPRWAVFRVGAAQRVPEFEDGIVGADELDEELRDWASRCFRLRDRRFTLEWLGEDATDAVHGEHGWTSG